LASLRPVSRIDSDFYFSLGRIRRLGSCDDPADHFGVAWRSVSGDSGRHNFGSALWYRRFRGIPWEDHLNQLEANGDAKRHEYQANHALTVQGLTTGRLMHFIDIGSGKILFLYGQQYFVFEPIDDDPGRNQSRQFPTRSFSLLRHAKKDGVLALFPGSVTFDPTVCDPIVNPKKLLDLGFQLRDGEILSGSSLDAVERVLKAAT
jgi:hypothetical protein